MTQLVEPIDGVRYQQQSKQDEKTVRNTIDGAGWSYQSWTDPPGSHHPPHDHPYGHRVLCRSGWIEFTVEDEDYRLEPGDTLDLPAGVTHEATSSPDQPTEYWLLKPPE